MGRYVVGFGAVGGKGLVPGILRSGHKKETKVTTAYYI